MVEKTPTDAPSLEAQKAFDEGQRLKEAGQYAEAVSLVERALGDSARLHLAQQYLAKALPFFERAFTNSEMHLRQEMFGFSEMRLASTLSLLRAEEEHLYALVRTHPDDAHVRHLALSATLLRKGRSIQEIADTYRIIYRHLGPADREIFERLRALRTQLATLSLAGPGKLSPADYQQRLKDIDAQSAALEADLARRSKPLRVLHALPPPNEIVDRVAAALPRDSTLLEFIAYRDSPLVPEPGTTPSRILSELRYLALLLFPDGRTSAVDLGPAAPIDRAALRLHDALARRSVSYQPAAQELYALAIRPLVPLLGKMRRLFLSPDGQLALVSFAALHDGRRFLVDTFDITYLTSGRDLLPRPKDIPHTRSVVVLADPDFVSTPAALSLTAGTASALADLSASLARFFSTLRSNLADLPWPSLPGTRKEAEAIHRLLPQAQLLLGPAATKDALLKLEKPGLLHIATHGFFLEDGSAPVDSRAVKNFGTVGNSGPRHRPPDPLLRSGLVLAGAHAPAARPDSPRREDSLVTALELAGMNLWGTQLVVLSACDTGRGDVTLGQGVYGLRRALVVAGAETLVTSLWMVNDETTRELMEGYYGNLLAGQGRTAALREAMQALRQKQPHPHFWAPFIAIGRDSPLQGIAPTPP
jgi:CHAT domain-containing protein